MVSPSRAENADVVERVLRRSSVAEDDVLEAQALDLADRRRAPPAAARSASPSAARTPAARPPPPGRFRRTFPSCCSGPKIVLRMNWKAISSPGDRALRKMSHSRMNRIDCRRTLMIVPCRNASDADLLHLRPSRGRRSASCRPQSRPISAQVSPRLLTSSMLRSDSVMAAAHLLRLAHDRPLDRLDLPAQQAREGAQQQDADHEHRDQEPVPGDAYQTRKPMPTSEEKRTSTTAFTNRSVSVLTFESSAIVSPLLPFLDLLEREPQRPAQAVVEHLHAERLDDEPQHVLLEGRGEPGGERRRRRPRPARTARRGRAPPRARPPGFEGVLVDDLAEDERVDERQDLRRGRPGPWPGRASRGTVSGISRGSS